MPRDVRAWILTKCTDYPPEGRLQLGQILYNPRNPDTALMTNGPNPLPADYKVDESNAHGVSMLSNKLLKASFGVWGEAMGTPAQISGEMTVGDGSVLSWDFVNLRGKGTIFGLDYVNEALKHKDVVGYVSSQLVTFGPFHPTLYMITGVRVAEGAKMVMRKQHSTGATGKIKLDGSQHGIPMAAGGQGHLKNVVVQQEAFKKASDFVFSYKCNKINYWPKMQIPPYIHGDTQSQRTTASNTDSEGKEVESLEIQQFAEPLDDVEFGAVEGEGDKDRFWIDTHFPESEIHYKYIPEEDATQQDQ
ncbi:hypothetical protein BDZ45DRAFT_679034 [Acephala macrosclerotiorum]|nr:hypothetical protein BDZ45DRAFT_679034 [Acephala macrosclerotiorum]